MTFKVFLQKKLFFIETNEGISFEIVKNYCAQNLKAIDIM